MPQLHRDLEATIALGLLKKEELEEEEERRMPNSDFFLLRAHT